MNEFFPTLSKEVPFIKQTPYRISMKNLLTFCILFSGFVSFSQRYGLNLQTGGQEFTKTVVKDYGTHQLVGGTDKNLTSGIITFWFAKMNGDQAIWSKSIPAHTDWAYMDISPLDIVECPNGDIVFIARGNMTPSDYSAKVIKVSSSGQFIWSKEILTENNTYSQSVYENNPMIVENDGIIITMAGYNHLQVTKINFDGDILYSKQLKVQGTLTPVNPGHLFIPNSSGGYYAGFECDHAPAIVNLDDSLNILWSRKIESDEETQLHSLLQLPSGKLLIGGKAESDAFIATLNTDGTVQDYHRFNQSALYSADQLFLFDSNTVLVNGRESYGFINTDSWSFHEMVHDVPFCAFYQSVNGWSFGSHWHKDYFLNFNPGVPECFSSLNVMPFPMPAVITTDTTIQATIIDMGEVMDVVIPMSKLQATVVQDCSLGLDETTGESFEVSPNPTSGEVHIKHPEDVKEIVVYDIFGKPVWSSKPQTAKQTIIDLSEEAPGIYLIQIDASEVKRLVKE